MVNSSTSIGRVPQARALASRRAISGARRLRNTLVLAAASLALATCQLDELTSPEDLGRIVVTSTPPLDSARVGSTARKTRSVTLTLEGGTTSLGFTAAVQGASGWLKLDAARGTAPGTFGVALDPAGVALGEHTDTLVLTSDAPDAAQVKVGITFRIIGCRVDDLAALPAQSAADLNTEDCESPRAPGHFARLFRFAGADEDSISIRLSSGSLAPVVRVVPDEPGADAVASSESCPVGGEEGHACLRYLRVPSDGNYLIEVSTVAARATGDLVLDVQRPRAPAAPASLLQSTTSGTPLLIVTGGSVAQPRVLLGAAVTDPDLDAVRLEVEARPAATPFTGVATATSALVAGPALTVEQAGLSDDVAYHWRARAVDATGRASAWVEYGGNATTETDFIVSVADLPSAPTALAQHMVGGDGVAAGATIAAGEIELRATVTDPDPGDQLRLEAEVVPVGTPFSGAGTFVGTPVAAGTIASVVVDGLEDDVGYRWRVRTLDQAGRVGPWVTFGADASPDFLVALAPTQLGFLVIPGPTAAGATISPGVRVAAQDGSGATRTSFNGPITIALAPGAGEATLSGTLTATAVDGVALFDGLSIDRAGTYALVATSSGLEATSPTFTIGAGSAAALLFVEAPTDGTAGLALTPAPSVRINDALGNLDISFAGDVTLTLGANPAGGTLSGTMTVAASSGIATFSDVRIDRAGTGYTLVASSGGLSLAETGPITVVPGEATTLELSVAPSPTGTSAGALAVQPAVRLLDALGNPVPEAGRAVTATISSGPSGATLVNAVATTDVNGVATFAGLAITGSSGSYVLTFSATGLGSVVSEPITLGAGAAAALTIVTAPSATARNGEALATQPALRLLDASGNVVEQSGVAVTARIASGGGTLGGTTTVLTGIDGIATFGELSITGLVGARTLAFDSDGLTSVSSGTIDVTAGDATTIARASVESQSAPVGTAVAVDPAVLVTDQSGNPVSGVAVTFTVTSGGGSIIPSLPVTTGADGTAALTSWTLGGVAGPNALAASVEGLEGSPVTFTGTGTAGAATAIVIAGGNNLTGPVGTTLGTTHDVRVVDANGNPVAGVSVAWAATGGGSVNPSLSVTDADGVASTVRTLGNDAGPQGTTATATLGGAPVVVTFAITATVGGATQMTLVSGDAQAATVGTALADPLVVLVRDAHGNPVPGVLVTWTVIDGGGSVAPTTSSTDASGLASTTWTLGNLSTATDSTQLARATAVGAPVNFVATSRPGAVDASQVLVTPVPTSAGASRTAPVTVTVTARDAFGNPVPNQGVVLAASGSGNTLVQPVALTNANGNATGAFGSATAGPHTITATVAGLAAAAQPIVTIVPAPAARLAFVTPPSSAVAGAALAPAVVVELLDSLGNRATSSAANVSVSLAANPGATTLAGTLTRAAIGGIATFPDLSVPRVATGYQLGATSGTLVGVVSGTFDISVGDVSAARSTVALGTPSVLAGVSTSVTVTARDLHDNPISGATVTIDATGDGVSITQPLGVTDANGVATGAVSATVVGTKSIGATIGTTAVTLRTALAVTPAAVSATTSTIEAAPTTLSTDGGSSTVTVIARDAFSNVVPGATVLLAATGEGNTLLQPGAVTNALGVAAGLLSSTRAGSKVVSATVNGTPITATATVTVGVGAISASQSSVAGDVTSLTAGAGAATITVTVRDAQGNPIAGVPVTLAATGTGNTLTQPSAVTDALGVATGTLASTASGTKVVTASASGTAITQQVSITVSPAAVDATTSTVTADPTSMASGEEAIITVVARDAHGNLIPGATVVLAATGDGNTVGQPAATDATGTALGTFSSTVAGSKTITATIAGVPITQEAVITVSAGAVSGTTSTVVADPVSLTAGTGASTITVTVRDADGNPIQGVAVTLAASGTDNVLTQPSGPTDANGIATGSLASTRAELKEITANAGGVALAVPTSVTVGPAALSTSVSTVELSTPTIQADGSSSSTITVTTLDAFSNPIPGLTVALAASGDGNVVVQPNGQTDANGVATGSITATEAGAKTITATVGGQTLDAQPVLNVVAGDVSGATSGLEVSSATMTAGDTITVTVTARDANSNPVEGVTVTLDATGTGNAFVGPASPTDANGVATARFTSTRAEAKIISAAVNGSPVTTEANVLVNPALPDATQSTIVADSASISADGGPTTITVTILDAHGNAIQGANVVLSSDVVGDVVTQPSVPTDASGVATGAFDATAAGPHVVTASVGGVALTNTVTVTVNAGAVSATASTATVPPDTITASNGTSTATITVTVRDAQNNPIQGAAVALAADGTGHTISSPAATNELGVTTATISSTVATTKTITVTVNGNVVLSATPTVVVRPGAVSNTSGFTVAPDSIGSDSTTVVTATVTARDEFHNPISGVSVSLHTADSTGLQLTSPADTTNAAGVAQGSILVWTPNDRAFQAIVGGVSIDSVAVLRVGHAPVSAGRSNVVVSSASTTAGTPVDVTVTVRDLGGNPIPGATVELSAESGTPSFEPPSPTDGLGQTTGTISSNVLGTFTVRATVNGVLLDSARTVTVTPAALSDAASTVVVAPASIVANGTEQATVTVTLLDGFGNPRANETVVLAADPSAGVSISTPAPTNDQGITTATVTATQSGSPTITATVGGQTLSMQPVLGVSAGAVSAANSSIEVSDLSPVANAPVTVTVRARDANNNPIVGATVEVTSTGTNNDIGETIEPTDATGTTTVTFSSTRAEPKRIAAMIGGIALVDTVDVTVRPAPIDATASTVEVAPGSIVAGTETSTITVTLRDAHQNVVPDSSVAVSASGAGNTLVQPAGGVANAGGVATATLSSTTAEAKTISVIAGGVALTSQPIITVAPAAADSLAFDAIGGGVAGATLGSIVVRAFDEFGNPAANYTGNVTLSIATGGPVEALVGTLTVAAVNGVATFADVSISLEGVGYTLNATADGLTSAASTPFTILPAPPPLLLSSYSPPDATGAPRPLPLVALVGSSHGEWREHSHDRAR